MKKQILTITVATLFTLGSATFISCGNSDNAEHEDQHEHAEGDEHSHGDESHEHSSEEMNQEISEEAYYCPMKCEGEKTYDEEGTCPTCGMDLVEVE